jgi:hypothetical protein
VPTGADLATKRELVKELYDAMHEVYPFPDDTRIFLREWPLDSVSQNGLLGSGPTRPVFIIHVPKDGNLDAKRTTVKKINAAVTKAYQLPNAERQDLQAPGHGYFAVFLHEHSLDTMRARSARPGDSDHGPRAVGPVARCQPDRFNANLAAWQRQSP